MGTYLSIPLISRKVVHLEPAKQQVTYEDGIVVLGSSMIEKMPMTPIHEENVCDEMPAEEAPPAEEAKHAEEVKLIEEAPPAEEAKLIEEAKPAEEAKVIEEAKPAEETVDEAKLADEKIDQIADMILSKLTIQIPEDPPLPKLEPVKSEPTRKSNRRQRKHHN